MAPLIDPEALLADLAEYRKQCAAKGLPLKAAAVGHTMAVVKRQRRVVVGPVVASVAPKMRAAQVKSRATAGQGRASNATADTSEL